MLNRRRFVSTSAATAMTTGLISAARARDDAPFYKVERGRVRQSVCHWCMSPLSVEELAAGAAKMGVESVELIGPEHWPVLKKHGLTCAIAGSHGFAKGFAHTEEHAECLEKLRASIDACAANGVKSVITFSGFRRELDDETARKNMIDGLKKIVPYAEEKKVTLCLEVLNSKVDEEMKGHPDYWADTIEPSVEICREIGSERMKILFDIYHVQIMQGGVIRRYLAAKEFVGHIHTAGNPGRHELDDTQEINYPAIMKVIAESGYKGFVGQEFIPRAANKLAALSDAVKLCDV